MAPHPINTRAKQLKDMHKPGQPLILLNVYDQLSARTIIPLPQIRAVATASYAIAATAGLDDEALTLEDNIAAIREISPIAYEAGKPLTVDIQDGYGERLDEAISAVIQAGAVGINLEDYSRHARRLYSVEEAVRRIKRALEKADSMGVPDFVVNARTDVLLEGGGVEDAVARGKTYLEAGATTAFVWGGLKRGGVTMDEVVQLTEGLRGRINVSMKLDGGLTVEASAGQGDKAGQDGDDNPSSNRLILPNIELQESGAAHYAASLVLQVTNIVPHSALILQRTSSSIRRGSLYPPFLVYTLSHPQSSAPLLLDPVGSLPRLTSELEAAHNLVINGPLVRREAAFQAAGLALKTESPTLANFLQREFRILSG
ncbi:MAG: hypothetical protein M1814_004144 [Vezdaea aestivalis]|nr:MAG: hypothetical protein M1814_004144 [Vezdaea aestivalis]